MKTLSKSGIMLMSLLLLVLPLMVTCDDENDKESLHSVEPTEISIPVSQLDTELTDVLERISNIESLTCDATYIVPVMGGANTKICVKGDKLTYEQMPEMIVIQDYSAGLHYTCDHSKNIAYKTNLCDKNRIPIMPCELENTIVDCDLSTVDIEILNGQSCLLLENSDDAGICLKIWLSNDYGFPLQVARKCSDSMSTNVSISLYDEFDINPELPDSMFELPVYFQVVEW